MRVAALVTGGKDSALALYKAMNQGHAVAYLVTMIPRRSDSWMFHYPNIHLADLFAEAVGIPHVKAETSGEKESELEDLKRALSNLDIEGVVSGAIASNYQKNRIDQICKDVGLKPITPLWHKDPKELLEELLAIKIETIIVGVYAHGFTPQWLGRKIDRAAVNALEELNREYQVSLVGEGGEYETLVLDAPFLKKKIKLVETEKVWEKTSGYLHIKKAVLIEK